MEVTATKQLFTYKKMSYGILLILMFCNFEFNNGEVKKQPKHPMLEKRSERALNSFKRYSTKLSNEHHAPPLDSCQVCGIINKKPDGDAVLPTQTPSDVLPGMPPDNPPLKQEQTNKPLANTLMINGGAVDPPFKYPWVVALKLKGETTCSGTIISENYILTAAHCFIRNPQEVQNSDTGDSKPKFVNPEEIKVAFLTPSCKVTPGPPVEKIISHPKFQMLGVKHDIGLLKLRHRLSCDKYKNPICLPPNDLSFPKDADFIVTGWGTQIGGTHAPSKKLKEANLHLLNLDTCKQRYPAHFHKDDYCLLGTKGQTPCHGDSGASLFRQIDDKYYVIGVLSRHTSDVCKVDEPTAFTSVPEHMDWIKTVTGESA